MSKSGLEGGILKTVITGEGKLLQCRRRVDFYNLIILNNFSILIVKAF